MCELYAVNSRDTVNIKPNCDLFYQHSIDHPDGWGLSFWQRNAAIVYRSPLRALDDTKYCAYLQKDLWCTSAMVHIRLATVGVMSGISSVIAAGTCNDRYTFVYFFNGKSNDFTVFLM